MGGKQLVWMLVGLLSSSVASAGVTSTLLLRTVYDLDFTADEPTSEQVWTSVWTDESAVESAACGGAYYDACDLEFEECTSEGAAADCDLLLQDCYEAVDFMCESGW